jgi:hypothetical protein
MIIINIPIFCSDSARWNPPKLGELCRSEIRAMLRKTISPPETRAVEVEGAEEGRRRRRKRRAERRRASRLLVVQRRRNGYAYFKDLEVICCHFPPFLVL